MDSSLTKDGKMENVRLETTYKFQNYAVTHADGTDCFMVYLDEKIKIPYRSLKGARQYIAKRLKLSYEEIKFEVTTKEI